MSRKDFQLIAETIKGLDVSEEARAKIATAFGYVLRSTNANFDAARFFDVCMGKRKR